MRFDEVDNGNCIPVASERKECGEHLWSLVRDQALKGRTTIIKIIAGERVSFRLPPPTQILDFASLRELAPSTIEIRVELPENNGDRSIWGKIVIDYS